MLKTFKIFLPVLLLSLTTKACQYRQENTSTQPNKIPDPHKPNGIRNINLMCYMNANFQILASVFVDDIKKVQETSQNKKLKTDLVEFLEKINNPNVKILDQDIHKIKNTLEQYNISVKSWGYAQGFFSSLNSQLNFLPSLNPHLCLKYNNIIYQFDGEKSLLYRPFLDNLFIVYHYETTPLENIIHGYTERLDKYTDYQKWKAILKDLHPIYPNKTIQQNPLNLNKPKTIDVLYKYDNFPNKLGFYFDGASLNRKQNYPQIKDTITLKSTSWDDTCKQEVFTLVGAIIAPYNGHFIAFVKKKNNWYYADDDKEVQTLITQDVLNRINKKNQSDYPVLVFYQKT